MHSTLFDPRWDSKLSPFVTQLTETVKVLKVFFVGEGSMPAAQRYLEECARRYNEAITNVVGIRLMIEVYAVLKRMFVTIS